MKSLLSILFAGISMFGFAQVSELKLASDVWPPFTNVEKEKSFALDLVREALNRGSIQTVYSIVNFGEVITGIDDGSFDGSAALWIDNERKKKYNFSSPYLQNQLILVGRKGSDVSAASLAELKGKRIGVVENYAYGEEISSSRYIVLVKGNSDQQNLERLLSEDIDYMLVDALLIQYLLKFQLNDVTEFLEIAEEPLIVKSLHFALRKDVPDGGKIVSAFNDAIKAMVADGSYNRILELNWIQADVDGDGKLELILDGNQAGVNAPQNSYEVFLDQPADKQASTDRYYIDGQVYESWEDVPEHYKVKQIKGSAYDPNTDPHGYGLKLRF